MMQDMTGRDLWDDHKTETYCNKIRKVIGNDFYLYLTGMFTVFLIVVPFIIRKIRKNLKKSGFTIYDELNRKEM